MVVENPQETFEQLGGFVEAKLKASGVPGAAVELQEMAGWFEAHGRRTTLDE